MACIIRTVLLEMFPQGLPEWCTPFLRGIQQLGIENVVEEEVVDEGEEEDEDADDASIQSTPSGSPLSEADSMDHVSGSGQASAMKEVSEEQGMEQEEVETAEANFRAVSMDRRNSRTSGPSNIDFKRALQAILLSDGQEVLPYEWLAYTKMLSEDWPVARETLQKALELEPWNKAILFRLSSCYERERNYIKSYDIMHRAMQLAPYDERDLYQLHFARLAERSKDMKANTFREDPFELLPLEVTLNIMELGLEMDDYFVLRSSWGLAINGTDVMSDVAQSKRQLWLARSKEHITSLAFRGFNCTAIDKVPAAFMKQMNEVKHLELSVSERNVLLRFAYRLDERIGTLETLRLSGQATKGGGGGRNWHASHVKDLCFSFVKEDAANDLQTLEVYNLDLGTKSWFNPIVDRQYCTQVARARTVVMYPSLTRLSVKGCNVDNAYDVTLFNADRGPPILEYQCDAIHVVLRGAPALEYLEANFQWRLSQHPAPPGLGQRITLSNLHSAIMPPPSLWCVDILAPNLRSLAFKTPAGFDYRLYQALNGTRQKPLIPEVLDSPVRLENIPHLRSLELVCCDRDSELRLEKWIQHLSSLTKLTIRSLGGDPWPKASNSAIPDQRAVVNVVRMLTEHPEWCPNLQDLELDRCFATGSSLIELVQTREKSKVCVNLERLALSNNMTISKKAITVLQKELPTFHQDEKLETRVAKRTPKEYKKDTFKK
ncbi:hypothetical protein QFC21_006521 [Naganishia friedmannii]|uniref:Uncharacterized protein n=1 Tax=Naganishia friedmannii TaxID=89922 RepID=A0ACC2V1J4_9TREE|nr:hypothetical protein QFC21_006521 [Naganishia friedmannii]